MSPVDIEHLRNFTEIEGLLMVIRCPKRPARYLHGKYPAKSMATKQKSDADGKVVLPDGRIQVSDYDLMCVYRFLGGSDYSKIFFSGIDRDNPRSHLIPEATVILQKVNAGLLSRFQHGAQDDYTGDPHPNAQMASPGRPNDRFAAFNLGRVAYLCTPVEAAAYYRRFGLAWPYDGKGLFQR